MSESSTDRTDTTVRYNFRETETKWQRIWEETKAFQMNEDPKRPK